MIVSNSTFDGNSVSRNYTYETTIELNYGDYDADHYKGISLSEDRLTIEVGESVSLIQTSTSTDEDGNEVTTSSSADFTTETTLNTGTLAADSNLSVSVGNATIVTAASGSTVAVSDGTDLQGLASPLHPKQSGALTLYCVYIVVPRWRFVRVFLSVVCIVACLALHVVRRFRRSPLLNFINSSLINKIQ